MEQFSYYSVGTEWDRVALSYDQGSVLVDRSILSLEGSSQDALMFLSSAGVVWNSTRIPGKQAMVSEEAYQILSRRFPRATFLSCHYFHPIALGKISVELVPSGESPGSSFLLIQKGEKRLFYASKWSPLPCPAIRSAVYRKADTLLVRLHARAQPGSNHATHRSETQRFIEFAFKMHRAGENLVVITDAIGEAHRLAFLLHGENIPILCEDKVYTAIRATQEYLPESQQPSWLSSIKKLGTDSSDPSVILVARNSNWQSKGRPLPSGVWVSAVGNIARDSLAGVPHHVTISESFSLTYTPDAHDLLELIDEVEPSEVILTGHEPAAYARTLTQHGIRTSILSPPIQDTLF